MASVTESENTNEAMECEEIFLHCSDCDLLFTGIEPYDQHMKGSKHKKRKVEKEWLAKSELQQILKENGTESANVSEAPSSQDDHFPFTIFCHICQTACSGVVPYKQHLKGEKHMKELRKKEILKKFRMGRVKDKKESDPSSVQGDESDPSSVQGDESDSEEDFFTCKACEKKCSGYIPYQQHMRSHPHAKQVRRKRLEEEIKNAKNEESGEEVTLEEEVNPKEEHLYSTLPQLKSYASCLICRKKFSGPEAYHQHMKSEVHKKEVSKQKLLQQIREEGALEIPSDDGNELPHLKPFAICVECEKDFSGPVPYQQHMVSEAHKRQLQREELIEKIQDLIISEKAEEEDASVCNLCNDFFCKECSKCFSGPLPLAQHLFSKSHEKQKDKNEILKRLLENGYLEVESDLVSESKKSPEDSEDVEKVSKSRVLSCAACHVAFSGPESAAAHFASRGHQKLQKLKERVQQEKNSSKITDDNQDS